jgi:ABC-type nitrate/sulfonate/bicarbonate transport system substrate-binding protein
MGYKNLANLQDHDVYAATVYMFSKKAIADNPKLAEQITKAHAEAIKRFYDDKPFADQGVQAFDKQPDADVARIYDLYKNGNIFERVPYVLDAAVKSIDQPAGRSAHCRRSQGYDFHKVIDNSVVDRLVKEGFFEKPVRAGIKAEEQRKAKLAFVRNS